MKFLRLTSYFLTFSAILLLFGDAVKAISQPNEISIRGTVVDIGGKPIKGVDIFLDKRANGSESVRADDGGNFRFESVPLNDQIGSVAVVLRSECTEQKPIYISYSKEFKKIKVDEVNFDDLNSFKVIPDEKRFKFIDSSNVDLGKITLYPFTSLYVDSDDPVEFDITYRSKNAQGEIGGSGVGGYRKDRFLTNALPMDYETTISLKSEDGRNWNILLTPKDACGGIHVKKRGSQLSYEICEVSCVEISWWRKFLRWLSATFR